MDQLLVGICLHTAFQCFGPCSFDMQYRIIQTVFNQVVNSLTKCGVNTQGLNQSSCWKMCTIHEISASFSPKPLLFHVIIWKLINSVSNINLLLYVKVPFCSCQLAGETSLFWLQPQLLLMLHGINTLKSCFQILNFLASS